MTTVIEAAINVPNLMITRYSNSRISRRKLFSSSIRSFLVANLSSMRRACSLANTSACSSVKPTALSFFTKLCVSKVIGHDFTPALNNVIGFTLPLTQFAVKARNAFWIVQPNACYIVWASIHIIRHRTLRRRTDQLCIFRWYATTITRCRLLPFFRSGGRFRVQ